MTAEQMPKDNKTAAGKGLKMTQSLKKIIFIYFLSLTLHHTMVMLLIVVKLFLLGNC